MKRSLLVSCLLVLFPFHGDAAQYALLVGIDKYQAITPLDGCTADVKLMQQVLTDKFGFPAANIETLLDAQATFEGIKTAFAAHLIQQAQPGDSVVFYYSGHGTQTTDLNGDEDDQLDETLCPVDIAVTQPERWLTDDLLSAWLAQLKTERVTVILDACFSGTATRADRPAQIKTVDFGFHPPRKQTKVGFFPKQAMRHVLLAASAPDQTSLMLADQKGSVFTAFLYEVLVNAAANLTYEALMQQVIPRVTRYVAEHFPQESQTPQLEGNGQSPVFFRPGAAAAATPAASPTAPPPPTPPAEIAQAHDFDLSIAVNKAVFYENDLMTVTLQAAQDCYVRVYVINAEQQVQQLFPNKWQQDNFLKAGQAVPIPGPGAKFRFRMTKPFGTETLKAVASTSGQFEDLKGIDWQGQTFLDFGALPLKDLNTRGVKVEEAPGEARSQAVVLYEIKPQP